MRPSSLSLVILAISGCATPSSGPVPLWDPGSADLFDAPWPTDARARADGSPDLSGFPNPAGIPLIDSYLALGADTLTGYGNNVPAYVSFDGPIDTGLLPSPEASITSEASVFLVDVDPRSPAWGQRVPLQWEFHEDRATYLPGNQLAVAPVWGFPLRPNTTYGLVVTTRISSPNPAFREVWRESSPDHELYAPLDDVLFFLGVAPDEVAVASVFTTGDPLEEMDRLSAFVHDAITPPVLTQSVREVGSNLFYTVFQGRYPAPLFQHGDRPYATEGGGFRFDASGTPLIAEWEDLRIAICVPRDFATPPPGGWPVVIQQHGTGGDYRSHCSDDSSMEIGSRVAKAGMVSIGIDQPLHGTRGTSDTNTSMHSFNYLNPESARANFRQGALDAVYLARALSSQPTTFTTEEGVAIPLDPERIFFFGHSQGGLTGALAAPFFGEDVHAAVLSGAGGAMPITLIERKDPMDIAALIETVAGFGEGEELTELHPVSGLVQLLVDVTDPLNYAPYWYSEDAGLSGGAPVSVLLTSGLLDEQTPHRTAEALAAAGRLPQLQPEANEPESLALRQITPVQPPLRGNIDAWDGTRVTSAISQWPDEDHFAVWDNRELADLYQTFLRTAAEDGTPVLDD